MDGRARHAGALQIPLQLVAPDHCTDNGGGMEVNAVLNQKDLRCSLQDLPGCPSFVQRNHQVLRTWDTHPEHEQKRKAPWMCGETQQVKGPFTDDPHTKKGERQPKPPASWPPTPVPLNPSVAHPLCGAKDDGFGRAVVPVAHASAVPPCPSGRSRRASPGFGGRSHAFCGAALAT